MVRALFREGYTYVTAADIKAFKILQNEPLEKIYATVKLVAHRGRPMILYPVQP